MDKHLEEVKDILAVNTSEAWYADNADRVAQEICQLFEQPEQAQDADLRERLAELEHEQWKFWARALMPELDELTGTHPGGCNCQTCRRLQRWQELLRDYDLLTEVSKDQDRVWADRVLGLIKATGYRQCPEKWPVLSPKEIRETIAKTLLAVLERDGRAQTRRLSGLKEINKHA